MLESLPKMICTELNAQTDLAQSMPFEPERMGVAADLRSVNQSHCYFASTIRGRFCKNERDKDACLEAAV